MNVVFRADANSSIGMGHIMRCLSIADVFCSHGCAVSFILADKDASGFINDRGYKSYILSSDYQKTDDELIYWPKDFADLIIVDSYYVTDPYLSFLKKRQHESGGMLIYIDDIYAFPYPADILINYNAYAESSIYHELYQPSQNGSMPHLILGPEYVPLRSMFRGLKRRPQKKQIRDILISNGGSDNMSLSLALLQFLVDQKQDSHKDADIRYHLLIGAMNVDKYRILELAKDNSNIILHESITDMKSLISSCDLAISAAGSTLYEICACGVPLVTYALSDNQIPGAEAFSRLELSISIGDLRDADSIDSSAVISGKLKKNSITMIMDAAKSLAENYEQRTQMADRMQKFIDGFGADRMVQKILSLMTHT